MRGRRDRQPVLGRVEADGAARGPDRREAPLEVVDHRGVEPQVLGAGARHRLVDRARDDVARREVGERMHVGHERDAVVVAEHRALAAQRLREERARHRRMVQRGRVELDELEVGARDAGLQRQRDAVAGRQRRVGGDREALADAAGREHDVDARGRTRPRRRAQREHAGAAAALDEQLDREPALAHLDVAVAATAATSARSISAPVASPPACTTRASEWPPSRASRSSSPSGRLGVEVRRRARRARARDRALRRRGRGRRRRRTARARA